MATSPIYKTSNEAGTESRRKGQAISSGKYEPGAFARQAIGTEYVPGQYASAQIGQDYQPGVLADKALAEGMPSPSSRRRGIAPSQSGPSAAPAFDPLKEYEKSILRDAPVSGTSSSKLEGNFLGDSANDLLIGGVNLYGAGYEIANLVSGGRIDQAIKNRTGKTGTENLAEGRRMLQERQSPALRAQQKELEDAQGFIDSFSTIVTNPRLAGSLTVQMAPQLATIGMAARMVAMRTLAWGAEAGLSAEAATAAASTNAARTVLGLNSVLEGGMAGGDTRAHILTMKEEELLKSPQYQDLLKSGMSPELARQKIANDASLVSTAMATVISAVATKATGADKLEAAVLGRIANKAEQQIGKESAAAVAKKFAFDVAKETGEETIQEGGSQFAQNVGGVVSGATPEKGLMEGVVEAAGAGAAMGGLAGGGFGGAKIAMDKAVDTVAKADQQPPAKPYSGPGAGQLTAGEMSSAASSPAFMAHQWSIADPETRALLQMANPNLDLQSLASDVDLVNQGRRISESAPGFVSSFMNQIEGFDLQAARDEAAKTTHIAGANALENAKGLSDLGMQEAAAGIRTTPPTPDTDLEAAGTTDTGVRQIADMSMEEQINRLRGYKRRAQNLERLPENYRREQAELAVQEMVEQGFPEEVARGTFFNLLGPSLETVLQEGGHTTTTEGTGGDQELGGTAVTPDGQAVQEGAPAEPVSIVTEDGEYRMSDGSMTAEQFAQNLSNWDNQRGGPGSSVPTDYVVREATGPLKRIADAFGVKVFTWDYVGDGKGQNKVVPAIRQGISMGKGVIGLNAGRTSQGGEFVVFGHELFHELAKRDPLSAKVLMDLMQNYLDGDLTNEIKEKLRGVGYKEGILQEEIVADVLGILFTEKKFWKSLAIAKPTLLEKIIDIIDQMIERMSNLGTREQMVKSAIKDLDSARGMMVAFLNEAIEAQAAGTSIQDNISLNAEQAEALQNVRGLLAEGKRTEAAAAFKAANLWKETGLNFNEVAAQEKSPEEVIKENERYIEQQKKALGIPPGLVVSPPVEEAEVPFRRPQEEVDAENAKASYVEVVELLRAGKTVEASRAFKKGNLASFGENFVEMQNQAQAESKKRISEAKFQTEEQKRLSLKSKKGAFEKQVDKVLSGVTKRVKETVAQRKGLAISQYKAARRAQAERRADELVGEAPPKSQFADDAGMVMKLLAGVGALGQEAYVEVQARQTSAEEQRAESDRLVEENATIHNNRVSALLYNADRGIDQLAKIRQEMAAVGYNPTEIESIVAKAESDLKSLRDGELRALAEEQLRDAKNLIRADTVSKTEPEEYPGFNEVQAELDLNDEQMRNALELVDAIERKEMSMDDALKAIKANKIGQMQLYDAMRQRGVAVPKSWIDISGNIAINYSLNDWVKGFPNSAMAARDSWFRAVDAVPEGVLNLTAGEFASYRNWKKQTTELRTRLKEVSGFDNIENAFPNALPMNYTLNEMRNPDSIPEGDRKQMIKMEFDDPVRAWFKDVQYIEQARPDLAPQFVNFLTKSEQEAYAEFREREANEARRAVEMKTKSALYSQVDGLRFLSPKLYTDFRSQISQAEEHQLAAIMQAAFEANEFAAMAKAEGMDIDTIDGLMDRLASEDAGVAKTPDEMSSDESYDEDGKYLGYDDSVRFKHGTQSSVVLALNTIESTTKMFHNWTSKPAHTVVQNPNQLPNDVRARVYPRFVSNGFKAAIDPKTGHLYLFSDFLEGDTDTQFAVFNEIYGQFGIRGFMGDSFKTFLENQYRLNLKTIAAADQLIEERRGMGIQTPIIEATQDVLGDAAIHTVHTKFANWLDKNGFPAVADWIKSSTNSDVASVLSGVRVAAKSNGASPLSGMPDDSMPFDTKKMPVEGYAYRDGEITAYTRMNPVTGAWTVFTMNEGAKSLGDGNVSIITTDDLQVAHNMMKKFGTVRLAAARETLRYIGPENVKRIMDIDYAGGSWKEVWTRFRSGEPWLKPFGRMAYQRFVQRYEPIFQVAQQLGLEGKTNSTVDDLVKYESRTGAILDEYKRKYVSPISKALRRLGANDVTIEQVDEFLMARHAQERNTTISSISPSNRQGSGMSTAEAKKILNDTKKLAPDVVKDMELIGKLIDQMSKDKLSYLLQTGMISKYQYEALSRYKHYVNLSGNTETDLDKYDTSVLGGRAFNVRGSDVIRSTGRGTKAIDVLQNTMNSYVSSIIRGQKNRVVQSVLDMFEQNPDKTFVEVNPITTMKRVNVDRFNFDNKILKILGTDKNDTKAGKNFLVGLKERMKRGEIDSDDALAEIVQRIREAEERRDIQPDEAARALRNLNEQVVMTSQLNPNGYVDEVESVGDNKENTVVVKVNGKQINMVFKKPAVDFLHSINGMSQQTTELGAMTAFNQAWGQLVTTFNPEWTITNAIRDVQTAIFNMAADPNVGVKLAGKMTKQWPKSAYLASRYQLHDWANSKDRTGMPRWIQDYVLRNPISEEDMQLVREFYEDGSGTYFLDRDSLANTIEEISKEMEKATTGDPDSSWEKVKAAMQLATMPIEIAPRLAVYKVLRDAGRSREEASRYAKELTVDFNAKGTSTLMRAWWVFANPSIQGTVRMFRDIKAGNAKGATIRGVGLATRWSITWGSVALLGFICRMIARSLFGDDDEERPGIDSIDKVADFKQSTTLTWRPDFFGGSIPVAYGWNIASTAGQNLYDVMMGHIPVGEASLRVMKSAFDSLTPIGSGGENTTFIQDATLMLSPSMGKPLVELAINLNRFGAPIYKEQNQNSNVRQSNAYQHFDGVNIMSEWMMHKLADIGASGNPRFAGSAGPVDLNPAVVDHMVRSYLPGVPASIYEGISNAIKRAQGEDIREADIPFVRKLVAKTDDKNFDDSAVRKVAAKVDTLWAEWKARDTTPERRAEIKRDHGNLGTLKAIITSNDQLIKKFNKMISDNELRDIPQEEKAKAKVDLQAKKDAVQKRIINQALKQGLRDTILYGAEPGE